MEISVTDNTSNQFSWESVSEKKLENRSTFTCYDKKSKGLFIGTQVYVHCLSYIFLS